MDHNQLRLIFRPHQFGNDVQHIDLYRVYDNLSRTPYQLGVGIECEDPDNYYMEAWHVITPATMSKHLDWENRERTQFISFYDNLVDALTEQQRRRGQTFVPNVGQRDPASVRVAHVRLPQNTNVWCFSRAEMLNMMETFGSKTQWQMIPVSGQSEWFVWGAVPDHLVLRII